jgi:hypothetical protein
LTREKTTSLSAGVTPGGLEGSQKTARRFFGTLPPPGRKKPVWQGLGEQAFALGGGTAPRIGSTRKSSRFENWARTRPP